MAATVTAAASYTITRDTTPDGGAGQTSLFR